MMTLFSEDLPSISWPETSGYSLQYGTKGGTTLALPRAWTPSFALVSVDVVEQLRRGLSLTSIVGEEVSGRLRNLGTGSRSLLVRSSVVDESIWDRGKYMSVHVDCTAVTFAEDLNAAATTVQSSAGDRKSGLLIHSYANPQQKGEFGNLHRVSKTRDHWELAVVSSGGARSHRRFNCQRDQAANPKSALMSPTSRFDVRLFGSIAAWFNNELLLGRGCRVNCEWIFDGRNVYVVQIDEEDEDVLGINPYQLYVPPAFPSTERSGTYVKVAAQAEIDAWDKARVLQELWEPNAKHRPALFVIELCALPDTPNSTAVDALARDFRTLIGPDGIVVRTSVRAGAEKKVNLRRTDGLSPEAAAQWCFDEADSLRRDKGDVEIAFVAHRFIGSRASAWVRAEVNEAVAEVHSLWGLPDALQFCPYDIWEVHLGTGLATEYPNYKSDILISKPDGHWDYVRVKNELARHNSISAADATDIARRTKLIAQRLGRGCHVMWFVGCVDGEGKEYNLPWYWTETHGVNSNRDRTAYRVIQISDHASLEEFERQPSAKARQAVELRPKELDLMRDNDFIRKVGGAANRSGVPVILFGSTLAHAYYILRTCGCSVLTPSEKGRTRLRQKAALGKLVRDKIPERIDRRQEYNNTRIVSGELKKGFLIGKLLEEAMEVRRANENDSVTEELADLLEVLRALAEANGVTLESVGELADKKRERAGGFQEGLVLMETGVSGSGYRSKLGEGERRRLELIAAHMSGGRIEIPFSFFGFMQFGRKRTIMLEQLGVWLEVSLMPDRMEINIMRGPEQVELPLDQL